MNKLIDKSFWQNLFEFDDYRSDRVQRIIDQKFQRSYAVWKNTLHVAYKAQVAVGIEPRSESPRKGLSLQKWHSACDFIEHEDYQVSYFIYIASNNITNQPLTLFNNV